MAEPDIHGMTALPRRAGDVHLERARPAASPTQAEHQLLHAEMAGVIRLAGSIVLQFHAQRPPDRQRQPLPRVHRVTAAAPALDGADGCPRQPDCPPDLLLRAPPPESRRSNLTSKAGQLFEVAASGLCGQLGGLELGHGSCMVVLPTYPAISHGRPVSRSGTPRRPSPA